VKRLLAAQSGKGSQGGSAGYTANAAAELQQRCSVSSPRDWLDPAVQSAAFRCSTPLCCMHQSLSHLNPILQSLKGSQGGSAGYASKAAAELQQCCSVQTSQDWLDAAV